MQQFFHRFGKSGGTSVLDVLFHDLRRLLFFIEPLVTTFATRNYMERKRILTFVFLIRNFIVVKSNLFWT